MGLLDWLFGRKPKVEEPIVETPIKSPPATPITAQGGNHLRVPQGQFRFVALDVETANSWPGSICQIGLACVRPGGDIETFGVLIDPEAPFDNFNVDLHGIGPSTVRGQPVFRNVLPQLLPLLRGQPVIQHSSFDSRAIKAACEEEGIAVPSLEWLDSVRIAQRAWPEFRGNGGHGLANLKTALGLSFRHHDATEDARAAAMVVLRAEQTTGLDFREILNPRRKSFAPTPTMAGAVNGPLAGHCAVFTGALTMTRQEATSFAALAGITVTASVTRKTTLLIVGDQDLGSLVPGETKSSKHRKAEELIAVGQSIRILGESEFHKLLANPTSAPRPPAPVIQAKVPTPDLPKTVSKSVPAVVTDIVVMASSGILPEGLADRLGAEKGMTFMKNVTGRTTVVVVRWQELESGGALSTRHRAAQERIANGQQIRIVDDISFLRMIAE